ncbi:MAG: hypothetical protein LBK83_15750 [Treponema sp.]|jgi:hypothetical protein|nr:hypothetical protein [Treponema sp.]
MMIKVDKTYKTEKITLNYIAGLSGSEWELIIGKERIYLNQEKFEELKAIMAEVLYGTAKNS